MVSQLSLFSHGSVGGFWLVTVGLNYLSSSGMVAGLTLLQPTGEGGRRGFEKRGGLSTGCMLHWFSVDIA